MRKREKGDIRTNVYVKYIDIQLNLQIIILILKFKKLIITSETRKINSGLDRIILYIINIVKLDIYNYY